MCGICLGDPSALNQLERMRICGYVYCNLSVWYRSPLERWPLVRRKEVFPFFKINKKGEDIIQLLFLTTTNILKTLQLSNVSLKLDDLTPWD